MPFRYEGFDQVGRVGGEASMKRRPSDRKAKLRLNRKDKYVQAVGLLATEIRSNRVYPIKYIDRLNNLLTMHHW